MGRILAVDFGHVRIGLALSDPLNMFASPLENIHGSKNPKKAAENIAEAICELTNKKKIALDLIIIGLPLHLDGSESLRSQEVKALVNELQGLISIKIEMFDERMTTIQAQRVLIEANLSRKKRARTIDGVSSTILLQSFLDLRVNKA